MMLRDQDQAMDSIAGTLNTIAQQASLMGQEIMEHNELGPFSLRGTHAYSVQNVGRPGARC